MPLTGKQVTVPFTGMWITAFISSSIKKYNNQKLEGNKYKNVTT
jgi:hypothetical protein